MLHTWQTKVSGAGTERPSTPMVIFCARAVCVLKHLHVNATALLFKLPRLLLLEALQHRISSRGGGEGKSYQAGGSALVILALLAAHSPCAGYNVGKQRSLVHVSGRFNRTCFHGGGREAAAAAMALAQPHPPAPRLSLFMAAMVLHSVQETNG